MEEQRPWVERRAEAEEKIRALVADDPVVQLHVSAVFGRMQIECVRRDWPRVREKLLEAITIWLDTGPEFEDTVGYARVAIAKHDEVYATPGHQDAILCPRVGAGVIGSRAKTFKEIKS